MVGWSVAQCHSYSDRIPPSSANCNPPLLLDKLVTKFWRDGLIETRLDGAALEFRCQQCPSGRVQNRNAVIGIRMGKRRPPSVVPQSPRLLKLCVLTAWWTLYVAF